MTTLGISIENLSRNHIVGKILLFFSKKYGSTFTIYKREPSSNTINSIVAFLGIMSRAFEPKFSAIRFFKVLISPLFKKWRFLTFIFTTPEKFK
jgi:hypothetical protein